MKAGGFVLSRAAHYLTSPVTTRSLSLRALVVTAALTLLVACSASTQRRSLAISAVDGKPGFVPAVVTVDKESQVVMTVKNTLPSPHGFSIEGYKRTRVLEPGQTEEIRFRASRGGTFRIYCQLHPAHGTATLVVR